MNNLKFTPAIVRNWSTANNVLFLGQDAYDSLPEREIPYQVTSLSDKDILASTQLDFEGKLFDIVTHVAKNKSGAISILNKIEKLRFGCFVLCIDPTGDYARRRKKGSIPSSVTELVESAKEKFGDSHFVVVYDLANAMILFKRRG